MADHNTDVMIQHSAQERRGAGILGHQESFINRKGPDVRVGWSTRSSKDLNTQSADLKQEWGLQRGQQNATTQKVQEIWSDASNEPNMGAFCFK